MQNTTIFPLWRKLEMEIYVCNVYAAMSNTIDEGATSPRPWLINGYVGTPKSTKKATPKRSIIDPKRS